MTKYYGPGSGFSELAEALRPKCQTCDRVVDTNAKVCPYCGRPDPTVMTESESKGAWWAFLIVIAIFGYGYYKIHQPSSGQGENAVAQSATTSPEAASNMGNAEALDDAHSAGAASSIEAGAQSGRTTSATVGGDSITTGVKNQSRENTPAALQIGGDEFPYQATLFDDRGVIVLQSEPSVFGKNVSKLSSGDVVYASSQDGKWIEVKTVDGLTGFVRQKQLRF